jgi:cytochrome b
MSDDRIKVWDSFVRVFHWALVLTFTVAYLSAEEVLSLHVYAGYALAGLLLLRTVWGFVGSRHARFSDFIYPLSEVKRFVRDTLQLRARRYLGHNPAGGVMILLMLAGLLLTSLSGIVVYGIESSAGPLAALASSYGRFEDLAEEAHEILANFTLLLVGVHLAGVVVESLIHHENLARAMVTGFKRSETP